MADPSATRKSDGSSSFKFYVDVEVKNLARPSLRPLPESANRPKSGFKDLSDAKKSATESHPHDDDLLPV